MRLLSTSADYHSDKTGEEIKMTEYCPDCNSELELTYKGFAPEIDACPSCRKWKFPGEDIDELRPLSEFRDKLAEIGGLKD